MKFIDKESKIRSGVLESDGTIKLIEGPILGEHEIAGESLTIDDIQQYLPPVVPPNIIAIGRNYSEHAKELDSEVPEQPLIFIKATTSILAHRHPIRLPKPAPDEVDYEAELVVVIGKQAKWITVEQAPDYIFGYTCGNDVSARDCQKRIDKQWARAKSFDTFAPVGPVIETELDSACVRVRSILNGDTMQDDTTAQMIFPVFELVSYLSQNFTLLPGTLIFTGTPSGVGAGRKPPVFLKPGDTIRIEIEGIGSLENTVELE
ncbi:MAG: fumarylacetoacetate hydrolase family protein [Planctomycetes bacterium]|nr:fumarylacetoacetate hydrolase family protein [Planctomycetota bacterium]